MTNTSIKIIPGSNGPVVAMIDYHSGASTPSVSATVEPDPQTPQLIEVASADEYTMRLLHAPKDNADVMAEHAADDPNPDASMMWFIEQIRINHEYEWEDAFSNSVYSTYRQDAARVAVPSEYPMNSNPPDGTRIIQLLANAVLRANLRCGSIYTVGSLRSEHGWRLLCDHKREIYVIKLVGQDWKLLVQ